jgi:hypothetical protein
MRTQFMQRQMMEHSGLIAQLRPSLKSGFELRQQDFASLRPPVIKRGRLSTGCQLHRFQIQMRLKRVRFVTPSVWAGLQVHELRQRWHAFTS